MSLRPEAAAVIASALNTVFDTIEVTAITTAIDTSVNYQNVAGPGVYGHITSANDPGLLPGNADLAAVIFAFNALRASLISTGVLRDDGQSVGS